MKTKKAARSHGGRRVQYAWRARNSFGVPAQVVGEELERLEIGPEDGHRTADIVEAARHPDSPLHGCFIWDDEQAAEKHRLTQARSLLRSIAVVIVQGEHRQVRPVYVHLTDSEGPRYVRTDTAVSNQEIADRVIGEIASLLTGIRNRLGLISSILGDGRTRRIAGAIDEIQGNLGEG